MNNDIKERKPLFSITASDCEWDFFRGSGKGGQKRNKTSSAVRCRHLPSGAVGQAQDGRSQLHNKQLAFRRMAETTLFKNWIKVYSSIISGRLYEVEQRVDKLISVDNLKIEVKSDGIWWKERNG